MALHFRSVMAPNPGVFREYGHLRLSIGLEDPADLIADIKAALDETLA